VKNPEAASVGNRARCWERRLAPPAVLRRNERRALFSANDDEVGGSKGAMREQQPQKTSVGPSKYELQGPTV
jgi:hypothetical protein